MIWQLLYRTTNMLRWGVATAAGDLSAAQIDKNTADIEERVWTLENDPPVANGVSTFIQSGNTVTVRLDDGSESTFNLPLPIWRYLEDGWIADTGMFRGDIFNFERAGLYLVLQDHVAAHTFDPNASNTDGAIYRFMFNPFAASAVRALPANTDLTYSPGLTDANKYLRWDGADDLTVTVLTNADVPMGLDTEMHFRQADAGKIIIRGDTGVTINAGRPGYSTTTPWTGAGATLKQVAIDEWDYIGPGGG